jgi:hypothetical protein
MQAMLPEADWVCLDGLGHLPMWDSPEAVAAAILEHTSRSLGRATERPPVESAESAESA